MMIKPSVLLAAFSMMATFARSQVVITELMQSNVDCVMDNLNEFPDSWVELRNMGPSSVNLSHYRLGLSEDANAAWNLPTGNLAPGGFAMVYCDKAATGLHTDFRLDSGKGGAVYLFKDGVVTDAVKSIPKQPAPNVAYGRTGKDSKGECGYLCTPTPAAANNDQVAEGVLGDPVFSLEGRVAQNAQQQTLTISLPEGTPEGCTIRYTTDGSEPTSKSTSYLLPITIKGTTIVRARIFKDGWISPRSTVHSYISVDHKVTLPVVSIVTDKRYLNDSKIGILVDGSYNSQKKNYEYDWRRPMNIELFESDGTTCSINQLCEGRVMGAASRGAALKSLAIYANKRFGTKHFTYEFFPDQRPGVDKYKSFLLRNAGNDFDYLYMRDAVIQRTMAAHTDLDWQAWRPAVVFINGVYKGILNIRDRSNDDNIFTYYDGLEDIDMIKNNWELQQGTWDKYQRFKEFYTEHGHTWDEYAEWMDLDEYLNLMVMNLYYQNVDFPGNNIVIWRPRTDDGRWRYIAKDTDFGLGLYDMQNNYNMVKWINDNNYDSGHAWGNQWDDTRLFRRLMEDADFQREFIDRSAIYMGDFLNERGTRAVWDPMYEQIKNEYPIHRALYNRWWPNYSDELQKARKWLSGRTEQHYKQLADYYSLGSPIPLLINSGVQAELLRGLRIEFNGVELSEGFFSGKFYGGRSINLEGRPAMDDDIEQYKMMKLCAEGKKPDFDADDVVPQVVKGWRVMVIGTNGTQTVQEYEGSRLELKMPASCACLQVTALTEEYDAEGVMPIISAPEHDDYVLYDLQGRVSKGARPSGIYLRQSHSGTTRKVVLR